MKFILAIWLALSAVAAPPLFRAQNGAVDTAFSPADLPGLALWLDADDASTLTLSGSVVDEWRDKSGNGRNFTGSGSARPALVAAAYNGRNAIQFDGVNDVLTLGSSGLGRNVSGMTVYIATKTITSSATIIFQIASGATDQSRCYFAGWFSSNYNWLTNPLNNYSNDSYTTPVSSLTVGVYQVISGVADFSNDITGRYVDGTGASRAATWAPSNSADVDSVRATIMADATLAGFRSGEVAEILVYHAAQDASTRAAVEAYITRTE